MNNGYNGIFDVADLLFGSYIRYDRMYEMTKFAFYGKTDSNDVSVYIDIYSILKKLYSRGSSLRINDSYAIASCIINLAIHIRAYFETRHKVSSKLYLIYGGARPKQAFVNYYRYNEKNILMEDSDYIMKSLIIDNLNVVKLLCPYLYDIFAIVDMENEFSTICAYLISTQGKNDKTPNIIYSKEPLAYQLVAYEPMTFLYRPKKSINQDVSWVVTKSTLYNAYRQGELKLKKEIEISLNPEIFAMYQAISGVRTRSMNSLKNANSLIKLLSDAVNNNRFPFGYRMSSLVTYEDLPFSSIFNIDDAEAMNRLAAIELHYQKMLYSTSPAASELSASCINLYDPDSVRSINNEYFRMYPLDLNRV